MADIKDKVRGLSHFIEYFFTENKEFVIIGGIAAMFGLEDSGIKARATKDIDLVVLTNPNVGFANKIKQYVREGGYQISERTDGKARNYRFDKPERDEYPVQIEILSTAAFNFELWDGQRIIPIETSTGLGSLSAILLDADYFKLVKSGVQIIQGTPVLGVPLLIPLKARAFLDLSKRKDEGESVKGDDITKHKNDVFRLVATLTAGSVSIPESVAVDLTEFFKHEQIIDTKAEALRSLLGLPTSLRDLVDIAAGYYRLRL